MELVCTDVFVAEVGASDVSSSLPFCCACCHMLISTLPMTQFWSMASSAHQYACGLAAAFTLMQLANATALVSSSRFSSI